MKKEFPDNFLWGSAVSAYQVEGGIEKSDWSTRFPAGKATDHYQRYQEDFNLLQEMNQKAFRFSIEWSRIEPKQGEFNQEEIDYYREYLVSLKKRGVKTMVTLHHFTNPQWFFDKNSWADSRNIIFFVRFAQRILDEYQDLVDYWVTINEPLIYSSKSFLRNEWPSPVKGFWVFFSSLKNQIKAHQEVYRVFHQRNVQVGLVKNNQYFEPARNNLLDKMVCSFMRFFCNRYFLNKIRKSLDFIGLNYYFSHKVKFPWIFEKEKCEVSDLGWVINPQGIYHVLVELKRYNLPIYITENGLADQEDQLRKDFIKDHLIWVHRALEEKVDVKGYFHWSLTDNFEWDKGFKPRFGLIEIDYHDFSRSLRPSALFYAQICKNNYLI
jgi:beta-glucosidase